MKTTLDIDPELYSAAEQLAPQHQSIGQVISDLLRRALAPSAALTATSRTELERHNGFEVFPERGGPKATVEGVRELCREEGI